MIGPTRIPLSPCDYLVLNHHRLMRRRRQGDYLVLRILELEGRIEPAAVRQAVAWTMAAHPVLMADLRVSSLSGRPYWRIPESPSEVASRAAGACRYVDLRGRLDALEEDAQAVDASCSERWESTAGPQIRLEQYDLPNGRTRFCFRWLHFLMDAGGGH